ncbi:hypothetical protein ACFCX4_00050 [Kitasatospora sp. NPDC056327]|uniref:hypothetical protein n=1 Tax=Kitasatospora sp. NPDC056327 TaxID=3345785 RepID=UPI0035D7330C
MHRKPHRKASSSRRKRSVKDDTAAPRFSHTPAGQIRATVREIKSLGLLTEVESMREEREARSAPVAPPEESLFAQGLQFFLTMFQPAELVDYLTSSNGQDPLSRGVRDAGDAAMGVISAAKASLDTENRRPIIEFPANNAPWVGSGPYAISEKWAAGDPYGTAWEIIKTGAGAHPVAGKTLWAVDFAWNTFWKNIDRKLEPHNRAREANKKFAEGIDRLTGICKELLRQTAWHLHDTAGPSGPSKTALGEELNYITFRCARRIEDLRDKQQKEISRELAKDNKGSTGFKKESSKKSDEAIAALRKYRDDLVADRLEDVKDPSLKPAAIFPAPAASGQFTYSDMDELGTVAYDYRSGEVYRLPTGAGSWEKLPDLSRLLNEFRFLGVATVEGMRPGNGTLEFIVAIENETTGKSYFARQPVTLTGQAYKSRKKGPLKHNEAPGVEQRTFHEQKWERFNGPISSLMTRYIYTPAEDQIILHYGKSYTSLNTTTRKSTYSVGTPPLLADVRKSVGESFGKQWNVTEMTGGPRVLRVVITDGTQTKHAAYSVRRKFFIPVRDVTLASTTPNVATTQKEPAQPAQPSGAAESPAPRPQVLGVDYVDVEFQARDLDVEKTVGAPQYEWFGDTIRIHRSQNIDQYLHVRIDGKIARIQFAPYRRLLVVPPPNTPFTVNTADFEPLGQELVYEIDGSNGVFDFRLVETGGSSESNNPPAAEGGDPD